MPTYRYLALLIFLVAGSAASSAQTLTLSTTGPSNMPTSVPNAPRLPKAVGESPIYIKIYGFYGLLTPGSQVIQSTSANPSGNSTAFKTNATGLGAGPRTGIGIGAIVSDFINIGIDADLLFGPELKANDSYKGSSFTYTSTTMTTFRVLSITPNITFKALSRPSYYIYNRLGVVGGIVLDYKIVQNILNAPAAGAATATENVTNYAKNGLALGYQAALGIQFRMGQSLRGFAEVVGYNQSFRPKESQYTSTSTKSGVVSKSTSVTQYKNEGEYANGSPYQSPSYNVAMNSIGVGVGLLFRF